MPGYYNADDDRGASGAKPIRPPMDGNATDDIGMMSTPMRLEHGYAAPDGTVENVPVLSFGFDVECAEDDIGRALDFVADRYPASKGADVVADGDPWESESTPGRYRVPMRIEFSAGPYASDAETIGEWIDRAIAGAPFHKAYNESVIYYTLQEELDAFLRPEEG